MELGEFVNKSLIQIIDGVVNSQKYAQGKGAMVNPVGMIYKEGVLGGHQPIQVDVSHSSQEFFIPQMIEFDIAVTVTEGGEIRAGVGVFGGAFGLGTQAKNEDASTVANRIKFSIPILFPQQKLPKDYLVGD